MRVRLPGKRLSSALAVLLILQLGWIGISHVRQDKLVPFEVGERVAFEVKPLIQKEPSAPLFQPSCRMAFACSRGCVWCSRRAQRYVASERDTIPEELRPLWLITADSAGAAAWAKKHGIAPSEVMALMPVRGTWLAGQRFGHIWFSPMRLVLQYDLILRGARPADTLLNFDELARICEFGGSAPGSIEELQAEIQAVQAQPSTER